MVIWITKHCHPFPQDCHKITKIIKQMYRRIYLKSTQAQNYVYNDSNFEKSFFFQITKYSNDKLFQISEPKRNKQSSDYIILKRLFLHGANESTHLYNRNFPQPSLKTTRHPRSHYSPQNNKVHRKKKLTTEWYIFANFSFLHKPNASSQALRHIRNFKNLSLQITKQSRVIFPDPQNPREKKNHQLPVTKSAPNARLVEN